MPERKTDTGKISAGEKTFTAGKVTVNFTVPNDIKYEYSWLDVTEADLELKSPHVTEKEVVDAVNQARKSAARQTAYMAALQPYKPDTMTAEERIELAVRNLILAGVPEELARQSIAAMRA